jgi:hypothetical protein
MIELRPNDECCSVTPFVFPPNSEDVRTNRQAKCNQNIPGNHWHFAIATVIPVTFINGFGESGAGVSWAKTRGCDTGRFPQGAMAMYSRHLPMLNAPISYWTIINGPKLVSRFIGAAICGNPDRNG